MTTTTLLNHRWPHGERERQHYSSAIALNPDCHLAIKNRADVRMAYASRLKEADALALVPPQNEMGYNDFMASMDRDHHLPTTFRANGVLVRLEHEVHTSVFASDFEQRHHGESRARGRSGESRDRKYRAE